MIRRPPRSTRVRSSAASDVYKRQTEVIGRDMQFLDSRAGSSTSNNYEDMNQDVSNGAMPESGITDDDIPF